MLMADFKNLDRIHSTGYSILEAASKARLGYEIVNLAEDPQQRIFLRLSSRGETGVGIDSDLPNSFFIPKDAGDYHKWSVFSLGDKFIAVGMNRPELSDRVIYLVPDHELETINKARSEVDKEFSRFGIAAVASPRVHIAHMIQSGAENYSSSEGKIEAIMNKAEYRKQASEFCRVSMQYIQEWISRSAETIMEEHDDIHKGKKVPETSKPLLNDLTALVNMYAEEMSIVPDKK